MGPYFFLLDDCNFLDSKSRFFFFVVTSNDARAVMNDLYFPTCYPRSSRRPDPNDARYLLENHHGSNDDRAYAWQWPQWTLPVWGQVSVPKNVVLTTMKYLYMSILHISLFFMDSLSLFLETRVFRKMLF